MTELDLGLKIGARKLFWSLGFSTRLDVQLRGERRRSRPGGRGAAPAESFTDLDVLGVQVTPGYQLVTAIADCKSGRADKPAARMFWARGVADLFGAHQIYLVREHDVNDATRQLSGKLNITVLPSGDLNTMQELYGTGPWETGGSLAILFDRSAVAANLAAFTGLDRRLHPLLEYQQFDYWVYEHHDNLIQLVAHLNDAASRLDAAHPIHRALVLDLAWLYLLALIRLTEHLRGASLGDLDRGLQEYLSGGATGLLDKQRTAAAFDAIKPAGAASPSPLPPYYVNLRELANRLLRRPTEMQTALRYAEVASALAAARQQVTLRDAFGDQFDPIAAKLLADVCGFLVAAGDLHPDFRLQARAYLLGEPIFKPPTAISGLQQPAAPTSSADTPTPASSPANGPVRVSEAVMLPEDPSSSPPKTT